MEYDILNDFYNVHGTWYLNETLENYDGEYGTGVYFTQINSTTLYTINQNGDSIHVYGLDTLSFHMLDTNIPINVGNRGCISSSETPTPKLYITGGYSTNDLDDVQVLSLIDLQWLPFPPPMIHARSAHGCIVVDDTLWAMGGRDTDSVEFINIVSIANSTWREVDDTLSCALWQFGITATDDVIFLVGGYCYDTDTRSDTVYTIDTVTGSIDIYAYSLPYAVSRMPVVRVNYMIYGFGGLDSDFTSLFSYMKLDLFSIFSVPASVYLHRVLVSMFQCFVQTHAKSHRGHIASHYRPHHSNRHSQLAPHNRSDTASQ